MIEEIMTDFYRIEVPLPRNPLKYLNTYLIKGRERSLLVDTGFNIEECKKALFEGLKTLEVTPEKLDLFITHLHADHSGLITAVATEKSAVYCCKKDAEIINGASTFSYWAEMEGVLGSYGFPPQELSIAIKKHPGHRYIPNKKPVFSFVREKDIINVGDYIFTCVETPGHTPGHMCLYETNNKILISGDHILDDITPNIAVEKGATDLLYNYLESLDKIDQMDINVVLPGHRRIINNAHQRIAELKYHHENRLNEFIRILNHGRMNAYQVASKMTWDLTYNSWEQFPIPQKWFATAETITHLVYLCNKNKVRRIDNEGNFLFELVG